MKQPKNESERAGNHIWTKGEIKELIKLWDTETVESLAEKLGMEVRHVKYMAIQIRKQGFELAKKSKRGVSRLLIFEALNELGLKGSK